MQLRYKVEGDWFLYFHRFVLPYQLQIGLASPLFHHEHGDFVYAYLRHSECDNAGLLLKGQFNVVFPLGTGQCYGLDVTFGRQAEIDCDVFYRVICPVVDQMNEASAGLFG